MRDPQAIAYHEAGHAIASLCVGIPVSYVEITDDGGCCENQVPRGTTPALLQARIVVHLSGGIAEAIYRGVMDRHVMLQFVEDYCGATTDLSRADKVGTQLSHVVGVYVPQHSVDRTMALLLDNWAGVQNVAAALVENGRLDGEQVNAILNRSLTT